MKTKNAPTNELSIKKIFANIVQNLPAEKMALKMIAELLKIINKEGLRCPICGSIHYHSKGIYREFFHRYTCNHCGRTFTELTGTAFASIHKINKMVDYFEQNFFPGKSVRKSAGEHNVNYKTIFYWRHKLAIAIKKVAPEIANEITQLFEFSERKNRKGNRHTPEKKYDNPNVTIVKSFNQNHTVNMLVVDSANNITMQHVMFGKKMGQKKAEKTLRKWLRKNKTLVVLQDGVLAKAKEQIRWRKRRVVTEVRGEELTECSTWRNLERAKIVRIVVKEWGRKFHGVATKYLDNYYAMLIQIIEEKSLRDILIKILKNHNVAANFKHQINIKVE